MAPYYPPELAQAVGYVVLEASDVEDSIGELIVLRTGRDDPDPAWWSSGTRLIEALESIGDPTLAPIAAEARVLLALRHHVVHALWLPGKDGTHVTMLRAKTTKKEPRPPGYDFGAGWSVESLADLAERFRVLDRMTDDAISDAMGFARGPGSLLPPLMAPVVLPKRRPPKS